MIRLLTDLDSVYRFDVPASSALIAADTAVSGTWVKKVGDELVFPTAGSAGAMQIITDSNRDGSVGWTPDVGASLITQLTVLLGKYRAVTDQFTGVINAGDSLKVNAEGKVVAVTDPAADATVAVCTKASFEYTHLGKKTNVIEYIVQ